LEDTMTAQASIELDTVAFRETMSRFASGVTIVTTVDEAGVSWGFTASAFCSLSMDPPLVLVCLDKRADCHPVFLRAERFAVSILRLHHRELAVRFATKGADKFAGGLFRGFGAPPLPVVLDALGVVLCRTHARYDGGDHTILIGEVEEAVAGEGKPLVYHNRGFRSLLPQSVSLTGRR
jgi:flavin reductase ActVB